MQERRSFVPEPAAAVLSKLNIKPINKLDEFKCCFRERELSNQKY